MKLGLIGLSIQKSSSPAIHKMLAELYGLPVSYQLHESAENTPAAFAATLQELRSNGYQGCNITYPFKQVALSHCSSFDTAVKLVGATNTLKINAIDIQGFNTDYSGFIRGYRHRMRDQPAGRVLLIGAGGVGRAVAFGLFEVGATEVIIYDLDPAHANSLANAINTAGFKASAITADQLELFAAECDGLINCTPIGHYKTPGIPIPASAIGSQKWGFDAVYTPLHTEFLRCCAEAGMTIVSGFDLFFYQALDAFEIFTGIKTEPEKAMTKYLELYNIEEPLL